MMAAITPWTVRSERKAGIQAATAEHQRSSEARAQAKDVEQQIRQMAAANHWAQMVAESLGISNGDTNGNTT